MNFCYELYRLETRRALARHEGRRLHILEVRRHELKVERLPERGRCRMRYYLSLIHISAMWAISTMNRQPASLAISEMRAKSMVRA